VLVVNNLLANVDGRAVVVEGLFDCDYCSINAGAIASRRREKDATLSVARVTIVLSHKAILSGADQ